MGYVRKVSGLTKEASFIDAFALGFMNNAMIWNYWVQSSWGLYLFPGADLIWSSVLAMIWCMAGIGLVYGILGGSMPRSGGEYIYLSRIFNPGVGLVISFLNALFVPMAWLWTLPPTYAHPGISAIFGLVNMPEKSASFFDPQVVFIVSTISILYGFLVIGIGGLKVYKINQRIIFTVSMLILIAILGVGAPHSNQEFIQAWNAASKQYSSLGYYELINAVKATGFPVSATINWWDTIALATTVCSWWAAYGFIISFIGGEIKRPQRNIILAQTLSVLVPGIGMILVALMMYNTFGREFTVAAAYIDNMGGLQGYAMPWTPIYYTIASIFTSNTTLLVFMGLGLILCSILWMPMQYICTTRALFAWSMDGLGPTWFSEIHSRTHSPLKVAILTFIGAELGLIGYLYVPAIGHILGGLGVTLGQFILTFSTVAIGCMIFPYLRKVRSVWETSPHNWKLGPIPLATIAGIIMLSYLWVGVFFFIKSPALAPAWEIWLPMYAVVLIAGIIWYYVYKWKARKKGIDIALLSTTLPPE